METRALTRPLAGFARHRLKLSRRCLKTELNIGLLYGLDRFASNIETLALKFICLIDRILFESEKIKKFRESFSRNIAETTEDARCSAVRFDGRHSA